MPLSSSSSSPNTKPALNLKINTSLSFAKPKENSNTSTINGNISHHHNDTINHHHHQQQQTMPHHSPLVMSHLKLHHHNYDASTTSTTTGDDDIMTTMTTTGGRHRSSSLVSSYGTNRKPTMASSQHNHKQTAINNNKSHHRSSRRRRRRRKNNKMAAADSIIKRNIKLLRKNCVSEQYGVHGSSNGRNGTSASASATTTKMASNNAGASSSSASNSKEYLKPNAIGQMRFGYENLMKRIEESNSRRVACKNGSSMYMTFKNRSKKQKNSLDHELQKVLDSPLMKTDLSHIADMSSKYKMATLIEQREQRYADMRDEAGSLPLQDNKRRASIIGAVTRRDANSFGGGGGSIGYLEGSSGRDSYGDGAKPVPPSNRQLPTTRRELHTASGVRGQDAHNRTFLTSPVVASRAKMQFGEKVNPNGGNSFGTNHSTTTQSPTTQQEEPPTVPSTPPGKSTPKNPSSSTPYQTPPPPLNRMTTHPDLLPKNNEGTPTSAAVNSARFWKEQLMNHKRNNHSNSSPRSPSLHGHSPRDPTVQRLRGNSTSSRDSDVSTSSRSSTGSNKRRYKSGKKTAKDTRSCEELMRISPLLALTKAIENTENQYSHYVQLPQINLDSLNRSKLTISFTEKEARAKMQQLIKDRNLSLQEKKQKLEKLQKFIRSPSKKRSSSSDIEHPFSLVETQKQFSSFKTLLQNEKMDMDRSLINQLNHMETVRPTQYIQQCLKLSTDKVTWHQMVKSMHQEVNSEVNRSRNAERRKARKMWFNNFVTQVCNPKRRLPEAAKKTLTIFQDFIESDNEANPKTFLQVLDTIPEHHLIRMDVQNIVWTISRGFGVPEKTFLYYLHQRNLPFEFAAPGETSKKTYIYDSSTVNYDALFDENDDSPALSFVYPPHQLQITTSTDEEK